MYTDNMRFDSVTKHFVVFEFRQGGNKRTERKQGMDVNSINQVKLEIYTPAEYIGELRDSLTALGACKIGSYDHVISWQETKGCWRPLEDSNPFQGEKGRVCTGEEVKLEALCPIALVPGALKIIRSIHPYEEPVIHIIPLINDWFE